MWPAFFWWRPRLDLDPLSEARLRGLEPETARRARALLVAAAAELGRFAVTSGRRTFEEQTALYAQGRTAPGPIVTYAPPGTSLHESGRAFDLAPLDRHGKPYWPETPALWSALGKLGEAQGLRWGGRWQVPDRPHFERRGP